MLEVQDTIIPEELFVEQPHEEKPSESSVASIPPSQEVSPESEIRE